MLLVMIIQILMQKLIKVLEKNIATKTDSSKFPTGVSLRDQSK